MAVNFRIVGIYGAVGVLVAALIIAGIMIAGVTIPSLRLPTFTPNTGTLIIKLTDAPVDLEHLNITIDSVLAQRVGNNTETWENLTFIEGVSEVYFDLLTLRDVTMDLSITEIPSGNYTMIKMHIKTANATYVGGGNVTLTVPSEYVRVIVHFEVKRGEETTVLIDMVPDWVAISKSNRLRPVLKATVIS